MRKKYFQKIVTCGALVAGLSIHSGQLLAKNPSPEKALRKVESQWNLLNRYCLDCHNFEDWAGGIAFDTMTSGEIVDHKDTWETVVRKMRGRLMPPPGTDKPSEAEIDGFIGQMETYLDSLSDSEGVNPGHIAVHRLNRKEYANAIEDILALKVDPKDLLPPDAISDGFDNIANILQVSPSFLEQYLSAARDISLQAVGSDSPEPNLVSFEAPSVANQYRHVAGLPLGTRGGFATEYYFPADGEYEFTVSLASQEGSLQRSYPTWWLHSKHQFILTIDGEEKFTNSLGGYDDAEAVDRTQTPAITDIQNRFAKIRVPVKAGLRSIGVGFVARTFAESDRVIGHLSPGEGFDQIPLVTGFKTLGPFNPKGLPNVPSREKIFSCYPESTAEERACAEQIVSKLARQAFRRPIDDADLKPLMSFYDSGSKQNGFETGIQKSIMAVLASTKFLYRAEPLPDDAKPGQPFPVTDLELATRLSFFLWSRGPDEELLELAGQGKLREKKVLNQQVKRMLADPRAESLTQNFAFQWLNVNGVDAIDPDPRLYPDFDDDLRAAFKQELALFVDSILRGDRSVLDLLNADHTFVDERLARHYGIDSERGSQFRQVQLTDQRRWGLLGKGGLLMLTSYPNRTSPVVRGAYVLETMIGTPPSAPPPGVETDLDIREPGEKVTTLRRRLETHREEPSCNQCHGVIDPLGLALENFNAIGQWRDIDRYAQAPIDAMGQLASGQPVAGPQDLREALLDRPDQFVQALTEKLMLFGLGRHIEYYDMPIVRKVVERTKKNGYRFEAIVQGIVESDAFQMKSLPSDDHTEEHQMSLNN